MSGFAGVTLRALMLLALIVWIGGIVFFSFVLAPTLFTVLPTTKLAGDVVSVSLSKMHWMAMVSGMLFLLASIIYQAIVVKGNNVKRDGSSGESHSKLIWATYLLVIVMLGLTWISQAVITPKIRELRTEMASARGISTEHRIQFDHLHAWSTRAEGGVFFFGLVVVVLTAKRFAG